MEPMQTTPPSSKEKSADAAATKSPDMKTARHRLDNLLSGIRKGDIATAGDNDEEGVQEMHLKKGPGRPRRSKRDKRITFELNSKPFSIRDNYEYESVYSMMRKWLYGHDEEPSKDCPSTPEAQPPTAEESMDLMVTKEIYRMPDPLPETNPIPEMKIASKFTKKRLPKGATVREITKENLAGWKTCRRQHTEYMKLREARFSPSMTLLKTVHSITQQNIE